MSEPRSSDPMITLHHGDCLNVLRELPDASVDAVVTDPPYGLGFMGREWDQPGHQSRRAGLGRDLKAGPLGVDHTKTSERSAAMHAGKYDLSANAAFGEWCLAWAAECLRVLKPGGHMLAFGGTRTSHRLACAIEDAGFEIRDSVAWLYGSGFPKSLNLVDEEGERTGWGTALKPAFEPIVVARKPLAGTVAANVLAHGTGALNIDACRVGEESTTRVKRGGANDFPHEDDSWTPRGVQVGSDAGRWPANVILDESQAAELDQQSGDRPAGGNLNGNEPSRPAKDVYGEYADRRVWQSYEDTGGASRFFYVPKAGTDERVRVNGVAHPTVKPLALMRWLVRLVTPPGGVVLEPFAGSGTTVEACLLEGFRCIAIEREADYLPLIQQRIDRRRDPVAAVRTAARDNGDAGLFELMGDDA